MSAYAEYLHAKTDEEREEARAGIRWECAKDGYYDENFDELNIEDVEEDDGK